MKALPQATAMAPIQHGIMIGKLNGVMPATTPSGWRIDQRVHVRGDLLGEVAAHVMGDGAGELDDLQPAPDLALGVVEGLAVLERHEPGEIVDALLHQALEVEHHALAAQRRRRGPGELRLLGDLHRGIDFRFRGEGHLGRHLAGRRVGDVAGAAARARDALVPST